MSLEEDIKEPVPNTVIRSIKENPDTPSSLTQAPDTPILTPEDTRAAVTALYGGLPEELTSPTEKAYERRTGERLEQFGYDIFRTSEEPIKNRHGVPAGTTQDDFILSAGDTLDVIIRGQKNTRETYTIDGNGQLVVPDLPPVAAAGRTLKQVRAELVLQTERLHNTEIFVSLNAVRQIDVLIAGHVKTPGRQTLTVFHTVLDALEGAGGIQKTGSLRRIKLIRDGRGQWIDLYGLLIHSSAHMDMQLRDGDRLMIPPLGPTVAVSGGVKRPGIYEILPPAKGVPLDLSGKAESLTLEELLDMAGGVLTPGHNRFLRRSLTLGGRETIEDVVFTHEPVFGDGSVLTVANAAAMPSGMIELVGHTRRPGLHDLDSASSLSELLSDETVPGPDIYPLFGVIERHDGTYLSKRLIPFSPLMVLKGKADKNLKDRDIVHLFARSDIMAEGSAPLHEPHLEDFIKEHTVPVRGAVRHPGVWPVAAGTGLDSLLATAGGLTLEADKESIEITPGDIYAERFVFNMAESKAADMAVNPRDAVRVAKKRKRVKENGVLLIGEIDSPGRYDLLPGDTLSTLIRRAGGLSAQAYPDGTVFSRQSERRTQENRFRAQARDLEARLAATLNQDKDKKPDLAQIEAVQALITQLKEAEAVGRITVEADPAALAVDPALDILLEPGDRIYIPQRPLTVRVDGEVLSPAALQFRTNKEPRDYIMEAGGFTFHADKDRPFVVYPDGSAEPLKVDAWNHRALFIPPGSTIIVPRDPKPFDFIETAKDVSQILSNLAITGIFLDDVRDDD